MVPSFVLQGGEVEHHRIGLTHKVNIGLERTTNRQVDRAAGESGQTSGQVDQKAFGIVGRNTQTQATFGADNIGQGIVGRHPSIAGIGIPQKVAQAAPGGAIVVGIGLNVEKQGELGVECGQGVAHQLADRMGQRGFIGLLCGQDARQAGDTTKHATDTVHDRLVPHHRFVFLQEAQLGPPGFGLKKKPVKTEERRVRRREGIVQQQTAVGSLGSQSQRLMELVDETVHRT